MEILGQSKLPVWYLWFYCTNPWCFLKLQVNERDVKFGEYPEELGLVGDGFYIRCRSCGKYTAIHRSMLFAPFVERCEKRFNEQNDRAPHEGLWRR